MCLRRIYSIIRLQVPKGYVPLGDFSAAQGDCLSRRIPRRQMHQRNLLSDSCPAAQNILQKDIHITLSPLRSRAMTIVSRSSPLRADSLPLLLFSQESPSLLRSRPDDVCPRDNTDQYAIGIYHGKSLNPSVFQYPGDVQYKRIGSGRYRGR